MAHQVPWNKIILEEFIEIGCLTQTEEMIIRTRVKGWTITKQAQELNMSESSIKRYISILPPRKSSAEETYMDEH